MIPQVNSVCKSAFYKLRNTARIRKYLSPKTTELLNCPRLCCALSDIYFKIRSHNTDITPLLMQLHWLPIAERIKFKIVLLTFKGLHDLSPSYIKELLIPYCPARMLRSSSTLLFARSDYNMKIYGDRAFAISAPELWNQLPDDIN